MITTWYDCVCFSERRNRRLLWFDRAEPRKQSRRHGDTGAMGRRKEVLHSEWNKIVVSADAFSSSQATLGLGHEK